MTTIRSYVPVLIVGGGPCGLTLSIDLSRRGISSLLIDAKPGTALNPQANATQARTMEHFRRMGFAEEIRALGLPADYPTDIAYFTRYGKCELARFRRPPSGAAGALARDSAGSWSAAELPHRVSQKYVETVLRKHAAASAIASLQYGWRLDAFVEHADHVVASMISVETGEQREVYAQYLIGVDGARSAVRRQLGIRYGGETGVTRDFFGGKMVAIHLRAPDFYDVMPHDRAWMYWAFNTQRRSWLAAVDGVAEFAFHTQLKPGESDEIDEARARELFAQAMGVPLEIELLSVDTWIAGHALVADSFGHGRVWIGGDAAHLFTPAGGLGYNTAVEDAVNLGWKLAAAVNGTAGPELLPSYGFERRAVSIRNTGYARQLASSIGNFAVDPDIEADGPDGDEVRALAGAYLDGHAQREFNIPGVTFGGRYDGSPIIVADGASIAEDSANVYQPTASPGGRVPHLWLDDTTSVYDLFGYEWTLLVLGKSPGDLSAFTRKAADAGMELKVVELTSETARDLYEADYVLIRPDQIVAWRGNGADLDHDALLSRLMGFGVNVATIRNGQGVQS